MPRFTISTLTAVVLAGTISVLAQEPSSAQIGNAQAPKETLTGCVVQAKTTDGGKAYVLNNVQGGSANLYVLAVPPASESQANANTSPETDITKQVETGVSKKVEVTGAVRQPPPPADNGAAADPKVLRPPSVQVESVKVVADTCK